MYKTVINSETIDTFSKDLEDESKKLDEMLDYLILLSDDLEKKYNSPTGKVLKDSLISYLTESKKTCTSMGNLGTTIKQLNQLYYTTNEQMKRGVGIGD